MLGFWGGYRIDAELAGYNETLCDDECRALYSVARQAISCDASLAHMEPGGWAVDTVWLNMDGVSRSRRLRVELPEPFYTTIQ